MQLFKCQQCGQVLYFENTVCEKCGHKLGYLPDVGTLSAVAPEGAQWIALASPKRRYRFCRNWMVDAADGETYCFACQHNRTIPDISDPDRHAAWQKMEEAKRRLFYSILKLRLPAPVPASEDPEPLVFDFLDDPPDGAAPRVLTGHDNGVITISLKEADDAVREASRAAMGEPYRTLLGHFRHEVGHYYWDRLVRDGGNLDSFRALFGNEEADYGEALARHYREGAPADWRNAFVSAYATVHPWEDWAETFAHYLHIVDTLEMASAFGIRISPDVSDDPELETKVTFDPHKVRRVATLIDAWLPLTYAVNCLNRSMGQPDLYPFVIPPRVVEKMGYIHKLIHAGKA